MKRKRGTKNRARQSQNRSIRLQISTKLNIRCGQGGYRNIAIENLTKSKDLRIAPLIKLLRSKGTFDLPIERYSVKDLDGSSFNLSIVRAASTDMWPMGTALWIRDNALIAEKLILSPRIRERRLGKEILISLLHILSTTSQLSRMRSIVETNDPSFASQAKNWPHIFLTIKDNLNGSKDEPWAHKQDALQILATLILRALRLRQIPLDSLTKKISIFSLYLSRSSKQRLTGNKRIADHGKRLRLYAHQY